MKYESEVSIHLPRQRVIELFDDPENLSKWQPGLKSFEAVSGTPGQVGAKSRLLYDMNGREIEMIETITKRDLPDEFSGTYDAKGVHNIIVNRFYEDGPDKTRWVTESEFQFTGLMSIMAIFMGGSFRKQTLDDMNRFKAFAESA
jgi:uncharacterized membrane protein